MKSGKLRIDDAELWMKAWSVAAAGAKISTALLLEALMLLPAMGLYAPPTRDLVLVLRRLTLSPKAPLSLLERITDAVESRLRVEGSIDRSVADEVAGTVKELENKFVGQVQSYMMGVETRARAAPLLMRMFGATSIFIQQLKAAAVDRRGAAADVQGAATMAIADEELQQPWQGWFKNPTVGWIARGDWLDVPQLQRRYDSPEEYSEQLQRLMTLLTFYWGAGALWPKCRHRQGGAPHGGGGNLISIYQLFLKLE